MGLMADWDAVYYLEDRSSKNNQNKLNRKT